MGKEVRRVEEEGGGGEGGDGTVEWGREGGGEGGG